jgi:hypothetical protein
MQSPPEFLDGARLLPFASLAKAQPTGGMRHVVRGVEVKQFAALAVAKYDGDSEGTYLFYCDPSWNVITDTWHEDFTAALDQANFEFGLLHFHEFAATE